VSQERGRSLSLPRLGTEGLTKIAMKNVSTITLAFAASVLLFATTPVTATAQTDCLSCHSDSSLQDSTGHSVAVDGPKFHTTIHGSLNCSDCHTTIKEYPHPAAVTPVKCETCHADEAAGLVGSVHANRAEHPCTSCHGDAHSIFPKDDPRSAVYPLNVPRTCSACHGNAGQRSTDCPTSIRCISTPSTDLR